MASADKPKQLDRDDIARDMNVTAFAFRGYNVTNLGRSHELLQHPAYGPILHEFLQRGSEICAEVKRRPVDLVQRVAEQRETSLATYDEAVAMVVTAEMAQLAMLERIYGIKITDASFAFGFSLGEVAALVASHVLELEEALRIPLMLSEDSVDLAHDATLGVLFSRKGQLSRKNVHRLCQEINLRGQGVIAVSAYLAPNSMLIVGQGNTLEMFRQEMQKISNERLYLRRNEHRWPPLHTPIVWQRNVSDRAQHLMHVMPGGLNAPTLPVFSLVTGSMGYDDSNTRELIGRWVDEPQRLWEAIDFTLAKGIETVIHVGPHPNIIPATFNRLAANVANQKKDSRGMRALSTIANRPWLGALLPRRASLLRAPKVRHIYLEDWLLDQPPTAKPSKTMESAQS
jgi:[acyl-carrier-protein] S-malonyltransferase